MTYALWRERLEEALDPRFYRIEHLDEMLASGEASFVANDVAAIVYESKVYPTGTGVLHCLCAAGDLEELKLLLGQLEAVYRSAGFAGSIVDSREGWVRALKPMGYVPFQTALFKEF